MTRSSWNRKARITLNRPEVKNADDTVVFQELSKAVDEIQAGNHNGGVALLTVGRARSLEMSLLGRKVIAQEAGGVINRCAPSAVHPLWPYRPWVVISASNTSKKLLSTDGLLRADTM